MNHATNNKSGSPFSSGHSVWPGNGWTLHKSVCGKAREAVCGLWSHQFGWELRLMIDGGIIQRSQVCRSNEEVLDTQEQWNAAMVGKGWNYWRRRDHGTGK